MNKVYTFNYTGAIQTLIAPNKYTAMIIDAYGAQGANSGNGSLGGYGGRAYGKYTFKSDDSRVLSIFVGAQNSYNGGGANYDSRTMVNGGGATDVRINGTALTNRIITAAGGGGASWGYAGGAGGGLTGGNGTTASSGYATGGTQTAGGNTTLNANSSTIGKFGIGGSYGGGGGWYGGGGVSSASGSAGGGSSHIAYLDNDGTRLTATGVKGGNGIIVITLVSPDKFLLKRGSQYYSILPAYYDDVNAHNFVPLTLKGGDHPNADDIANFGFSDPVQLSTAMTKGTDTFLPFDKLKALGGIFDLRYYYYNGV